MKSNRIDLTKEYYYIIKVEVRFFFRCDLIKFIGFRNENQSGHEVRHDNCYIQPKNSVDCVLCLSFTVKHRVKCMQNDKCKRKRSIREKRIISPEFKKIT